METQLRPTLDATTFRSIISYRLQTNKKCGRSWHQNLLIQVLYMEGPIKIVAGLALQSNNYRRAGI
jgi:hypothetical protein